jgi:uncharacterized protein
MLTSQEALYEVDFAARRIYPDRLNRKTHGQYATIAEKLLNIYRNGIGKSRQQLHREVNEICAPVDGCPLRRIAAFTKLLDDAGQFDTDAGRRAAALREKVFRAAAPFHPLVKLPSSLFGSQEWEIKQRIAKQLNMPWPAIERQLFADVIDFHYLNSFDGYSSGREFLARYNVAQVQACLYRACKMVLWARTDLKAIVQLIKLSRLMHRIERTEDGITRFILDGPASALRGTRRYGVAMARMIPGLLTCSDWQMAASIRHGPSQIALSLQLSSSDGLSSPKSAPIEFDSEVEADLMQKWNQLPLTDWKLERESELLVQDQKIFLPDFVATHRSGRRVFIEVIGFWTPEYLESKCRTLEQFKNHDLIIIAQADKRNSLANLPESLRELIVWYKTKISLSEFHGALEKFLSLPPNGG